MVQLPSLRADVDPTNKKDVRALGRVSSGARMITNGMHDDAVCRSPRKTELTDLLKQTRGADGWRTYGRVNGVAGAAA